VRLRRGASPRARRSAANPPARRRPRAAAPISPPDPPLAPSPLHLSQNALRRVKPVYVQAAMFWGTTAAITGIWLTQPFDFIKAQLSPPPPEDAKQ
jgi:hypothetical protein